MLPLSQHPCYLLQIVPICLVEGVEIGAVDVEDCHYSSVVQNRNNDFAVGGRGARYMSGKLMNVGHDDCLGALPSRATDTATKGDACAGNRTLEGT